MAQEKNAATQAVANIYRTPELWSRISFTFLCLVIYRTGAHITAPGIDVQALSDYFAQQAGGGLLGLYDPIRRWRFVARNCVCARHHAVHLGQHFRADRWCSNAAGDEDAEGRGRSEEAHTVYPLHNGGTGARSGLWFRTVHVVAAERRFTSGSVVHDSDDAVSYRWRDLCDVAW